MSRPKPTIIAEQVDKKTYLAEQILESTGIYAVYYNNKPINLRSNHLLLQEQALKYKKVSFSNQGHAINLAKKLNQKFKTDQFTVVLLTQGEQVYPKTNYTQNDN